MLDAVFSPDLQIIMLGDFTQGAKGGFVPWKVSNSLIVGGGDCKPQLYPTKHKLKRSKVSSPLAGFFLKCHSHFDITLTQVYTQMEKSNWTEVLASLLQISQKDMTMRSHG